MGDSLLTHLQKAAGEGSAEPWNEDYLPYYFQRFRPRGEGIKAALSIVPNAKAYVARLLPIYEATNHPGWENEMYFVVRQPIAAKAAEVVALGDAFLANLRLLADVDEEFSAYLNSVKGARLLTNGKLDRTSDDHTLVYEAVGDFFGFLSNEEDIIPKLYEAYYTIACDPDLTRYLQWPYFKELRRVDIFEPYFQLWRRGYSYEFRGDALLLARR